MRFCATSVDRFVAFLAVTLVLRATGVESDAADSSDPLVGRLSLRRVLATLSTTTTTIIQILSSYTKPFYIIYKFCMKFACSQGQANFNFHKNLIDGSLVPIEWQTQHCAACSECSVRTLLKSQIATFQLTEIR
ncbi:hypothetical protein GQX74_002903 [Glossina fuscipes]|nr:hypothetical protein GQX74_002903 [Glossina fuscipes]